MPAPANDAFADALALTGTSGSGSQDLTDATGETDEPVGGATSVSAWLKITPADPSFVQIDLTHAGVTWHAYEGDTLAELSQVTTGSTWPAAAGTTYHIRIAYTGGGTPPTAVAYAWDVFPRNTDLTLLIPDPEIDQTPDTLRVNVADGTPGAAVTFTIGGVTGTQWADVLDGSGLLTDAAIPIPALDADDYVLTVTETVSGDNGGEVFTVLTDPAAPPADLPGDTPPVAVPGSGVRRWIIQDPVDASIWTFPLNPAEMTSPHRRRDVTAEVSTAVDGQVLTWEGAARPHAWQFSGYLNTQAHHDTLAGYAASDQRHYLIDHRNRAWVVLFEAFEAQPQIHPNVPWSHRYTMRCLILAGPEQL